MQLYLTQKNQFYKPIQPLHLWIGGIHTIQLKQKLGEPAVLRIEVNRNLGQFLSILRDVDDLGIRLIDSKSKIDIAFIRREDSQIDTETGSSFEFVSFVRAIRNKKPYYNQNQVIGGLTQANLVNLDSEISWAFVGSDKVVNYNAGSKNNLEILNEVCKKAGWTYCENGFVSLYVVDFLTQTTSWQSLPQILVGDFRQMSVSRIITNHNPYNIVDACIISEPKRKNKITSYKYHKVVGVLAGSGTGNDSIILNSSVNADLNYPIVNLFSGRNTQGLYIDDSSQSISGADYDTLTIQLWSGATAQDLYNLALLEIIKSKTQYLYEFEIMSPTFIQAGEKIKIEYHSQVLPLFLTTTVKESQYDYATGFCKILVSDEPTIITSGRNIYQVQQALDIIREQQTSPQ